MHEDFLLTTKLAQRLYHDCAADLPLIDYHNHLSIDDIAGMRRFADLAELWLLSDPYKHRAMRICGVAENLVTGDASHLDKFRAWCSIYPDLIGNPLYHWSAIELQRVFGIDLPINKDTADEIWHEANARIADPVFTARALLERFKVVYAAPCTPLTGDLTLFDGIAGVAPSLRSDDLFPLTAELLLKLAACTGTAIDSLDQLATALSQRLDAFHALGCRFSDQALDHGFCYVRDDGYNEKRFAKLLAHEDLDESDHLHLRSAVLRMLGDACAGRRWVMQFHVGALRDTSSRLRSVAGPAGGFAGIGRSGITALTALLDDLEQGKSGLPRVVLFTINPADEATLAVLSGSYVQDGLRGKVQLGPPWWWCDHLNGMRELFECISAFGVLSTFIGMTTDSRSFLSLVRHEYFRRTLCGWIGEKAEQGAFPDCYTELAQLISAVCYRNAGAVLAQAGLDVAGQI